MFDDRDYRPLCPVCDKRISITYDHGCCSSKCGVELKRIGCLEHIADTLERIENLLIKRLTVAMPQKDR